VTGSSHPPRAAAEIRAWVRARSPQPFDDAAIVPPPSHVTWIYGPGQYELALLCRLVDEGFAANRHVHYPRNHGRPAAQAQFRVTTADAAVLRLRVTGRIASAEICTGSSMTPTTARSGEWSTVAIPAGAMLQLSVVSPQGGAAAIAVPADDPALLWQARTGDGAWLPVRTRPGGEFPPHIAPVGEVTVPARRIAPGRYDVGVPVLGRPLLPAGPRAPKISSGESAEEAFTPSTLDARETRHDVMQAADGGWTTVHRLGFRYLAVQGPGDLASIPVRVSVAAAPLPGAFACSDEQLTQIWSASQYTLRTCMQGLMIDGIKRDRMPWAGDQALSTLANAYALGQGGVVADGLVALGRPDHGYVNGLADYSLWQVVNAGARLRCFGDLDLARAEADQLDAFVADIARQADADGVFHPERQEDGFSHSGAGSVFLDWGISLDDGRDPVALEMLWLWALRSAGHVLDRCGHPGAVRWRALATTLRSTLRARAWLKDDERWAGYLDGVSDEGPSRYANFLAVLAGMHENHDVPAGVLDAITVARGGTPFMTAFRLSALLKAGKRHEVLADVRRIWGAMLDRGPGTFWEQASVDGDFRSMYDRPFGRSLCHAWASGPAALLPDAVLGVRPLDDAWLRFEVRPELGDLRWASAVVPTPHGDIVVHAIDRDVNVEVPEGCTLVRDDGNVSGAATVSWRGR
jgi:hypothetical protein